SRASVSRETFATSANSAGPKISGNRPLLAARPNMSQHPGQSRGRDAIDTGRLPQGRRADTAQLLNGFGRKAMNLGVVEVVRKIQGFVPAESQDVGVLPVHVTRIARVDFELFDDLRRDRIQFRPDARHFGKSDVG